MKKRIIGMLLILTIILSTFAVGMAADNKNRKVTNNMKVGYLPGDPMHTVTKDDCIEAENAEILSKGVQINPGGSATFGFSTRYALRSVKLVFEMASGTTTLNTEENTYTADLNGDGTYTLEFGVNLGKEPQLYCYNGQSTTGFYRDYVERRGEHEVTVSSTGGMLLKEMIFERDKTPQLTDASFGMVEHNLTEVENTFLTTIAMRENASVIFVNGARRYLDNNDTSMRPYNDNGTLYIPINTLAKALGYYHEDQPERNYALMRSDTHEYVLLDGKALVSAGVKDYVEPPFDAIIHRDGKTLAAVRYFAELAGETVTYQDGLVVIEDKYASKKILENESLVRNLNDALAPFEDEAEIGTTYYVAQNNAAADDNNVGSALAPFKTLAKAAKVAKAGDTVIVREGIYRETLTPENDGEPTAPITFRAAEGENVVISANEVLGKWVPFKNNIYVTPMTWDLGKTRNQIFIDGSLQTEARHPNGPGVIKGSSPVLSNAWPVRGDLYRVSGEANENLVRSATQLWQEKDHWTGGIFVGLFGSAWNMCSANIASSAPGELVLGPEKTGYWFSDTDSHTDFNYGFIVGHMNALDSPGEWHLQDGNLYMIFPEGTKPNENIVEAKQRSLVVDLNDRKFVNVEGFDTIGGSVRMNGSEMCMMNGVDMKYISHFYHTADQHAGYIDFDYAAGPQTSGMDAGNYGRNRKDPDGAPERGIVGNYITGTDNIFVNGSVDHSAGSAFYLSGRYTYLENNIIGDIGYMSTFLGAINIVNRGYEDITIPTGGHAILNNTIYNVGRSNLNMAGVRDTTVAVPYLPIDFGYNDLHDGVLTSADTGLTYGYGVSMGYDGVMSKEHHNYVYMTTDEVDNNPLANGIYHDNGNYGLDSFKNKIFYTKENSGFSGFEMFEQTMPHAVANFMLWDNTSLGHMPEGVDGFIDGYFVEDKPFFAGALQNVDYTKNYDRFKAGKFGMQMTAQDAELSEGVTIDEESGYAKFSGDGQWVKFSNVDMGEQTNLLSFAVRGNAYQTYDQLDVIIGDTIETGELYPLEVINNAHDGDVPILYTKAITPVSGIQNVFVRVNDYESLELGGCSVYCVKTEEKAEEDEFALDEYGAGFSEFVRFDDNKGVFTDVFPTAKYTNPIDPEEGMVTQTRPGYYIKYSQKVLTADADRFAFNAASGGQWAHQPVEVYVDTLESDGLVAKFNIKNDTWGDQTIQVEPLLKEVKAGTHDIYLKFTAEDGYDKASDIRTISFVKKGVELKEFADARVKVYGGNFDASLSIQNALYPFRAELMNPPNYINKGLTYTLPGTVAGYKEVDLPIDATKFVINYASEQGIDGQTVDVRVGSLNSEPVASFTTEGNGLREFNIATVELTRTIPKGTYNVYLSFGGDAGAKKNLKIDWFGFNY